MKKERIKLTELENAYKTLTADNGQLRTLNFIAAGNISKGSKNRRERLVDNQLKLMEQIRLQTLKVKIVEGLNIDIKDIEYIVYWHCRKAKHIQIREVSMYERESLSRFPIGNLYDIVFKAEKSLQSVLKKYGLTYNNQNVIINKVGAYIVTKVLISEVA